jgi:hypothetical protein
VQACNGNRSLSVEEIYRSVRGHNVKEEGKCHNDRRFPITVLVIPSDGERVFIEDVAARLSGDYADHMNFQYSFAQPEFERK